MIALIYVSWNLSKTVRKPIDIGPKELSSPRLPDAMNAFQTCVSDFNLLALAPSCFAIRFGEANEAELSNEVNEVIGE